ncbi:PLP-dependent aminotransferase family protein, partial [Staphylococcus epidermidis]
YLNRLDLPIHVTEITPLHHIHYPQPIILQTIHNFTKHKNYHPFLLLNPTTSPILSVIQAFSTRKPKYLITTNLHKSLFHALHITQQQATITNTHITNKTNQYLKPKIIQHKNQYYKLPIST